MTATDRSGLPGTGSLAGTGDPEAQDPLPFAMDGRYPLWLREISGSLPATSQYVVAGNIRDLHLMPAGGSFLRTSTLDALWTALAASGFECLLVFDPVDHLRVHLAAGQSQRSAARAREVAGEVLGGDGDRREMTLTRLGQVARRAVTSQRHRVALVIDYASRLTPDPAHPGDEERAFLVTMEKLSHAAQPLYLAAGRAVAIYNAVFWLVGSERDLPAWLTAGNDAIRTVSVPLPDLGERLRLAGQLTPSLPGAGTRPTADSEAAIVFAEQAQGMTLRSMVEIGRLAIDRGVDVADIEDAVRGYRVGMLENPWKKPYLRGRIRSGPAELAARVRGQDRAIRKSIDILIRSATGLTGAHASAHAARPRGILFFAGPTGVGKTELAKAITELVFGDENAYARFDMSEFSAEHSEARLIGAPPGYVGHDAGGELTNAVRERPFSLILFDEVEKAHPRILDKFLQVLEDGRLTDGAGNTVHFSETLLVFTSNLGIYTEDEPGRRTLNVTPTTPREELEDRIRRAIRDHFTLRLNRPELLNRIGDNIVVFDFISQPVGAEIADLFLGNVATRVAKELKVPLTISEAARHKLIELATADLTFGGRGVGSILETALVNPLARALFQGDAGPGQDAHISDVVQTADGWEVRLA